MTESGHGLSSRVAVIGAGVTGLSAALALEKAGKEVLLLEASDRVGGVITSREQDGFRYELGPATLQRGDRELESLLEELGLVSEILSPPPESPHRFILKDGKLVALPTKPWQFPFSPWLSWRGKLRLLTEPFRGPGNDRENESLADFTRRRLGQEVLQYGVDPFVCGIYAGDPESLSVRLAFPRLYRAEGIGGSLVRGFPRVAREGRTPGENRPRPPRGPISFCRGLAQLPEAMVGKLKTSPRLGASLTSIQLREEGSVLEWEESGEVHQETVAGVIVSSWHPALADKIPLPPRLSAWPAVDYASVQVTTIAFPREAVNHPLNGFGVLVPSSENQPFLGAIFASSLFPDRAPRNQVLLQVFTGGKRHPGAIHLSDEEFLRQMEPAIQRVHGISQSLKVLDSKTWDPAIPQYTLSHQNLLEARRQVERHFPGLVLAGNHFDGISLPNCLKSGREAAEKLA